MSHNNVCIVFSEHQTAEKELNPEECQQEINDDEKAIDQREHELEELSAKVIL